MNGIRWGELRTWLAILTAPLQVAWIPDGDHSFKPRKRSGRTESMNWQLAVDLADQFMREKLA